MKRPEKLYQFQRFGTRSLVNLKKHQLFFSSPAEFNDPFDCAIHFQFSPISDDEYIRFFKDLTKEDRNPSLDEEYFEGKKPTAKFKQMAESIMRAAIESLVKERHKNRGVACFSEKNDDILMWGHYACGHTGFCLEFDSRFQPFNGSQPVTYQSEFPILNPVKAYFNSFKKIDSIGEDDFARALTTKFTTWSYEKEWRAIHIEPNKLFNYPIEAITGLYFGLKMPFDHKEIIALILRGINPAIQLFEAQMDENSFALNFSPVSYTSPIELSSSNQDKKETS